MRAMFESLSPAWILLAALIFDAVVGDPYVLYRTVPHPVALIGRAIAALDAAWNRPERGPRTRRLLGVALLLVIAGGAALVGAAILVAARALPYGWVVEALCVYVLIAQKSLFLHVRAVARALKAEGLAGGRRAVGMIVGRDPETLDEAGVCRAAVESCAESYSDGIVSPIFWYAVLGLPGICAFKAVNTLDSMVGHLNEKYRDFGWASARFDDLANWIPARIAGWVLALAAAPFSWADGHAAAWIMLRDAGKHHSPNAGWPESAIAGALGLKLLGPRIYPGEVVDAPWIGEGTPDATPEHIARALKLYLVACTLNGLAAVAALALV
jgi:adenosylcobinamide-phosphate synthase